MKKSPKKDHLEIMTKIASEQSNNEFAWYTKSDLQNEIWGIMLEVYPEYSPSHGPLENYLRVCVKNRLHNLYYSIKPKTKDEGLKQVLNELVSVQHTVMERGHQRDIPTLDEEEIAAIKAHLPENILFLVSKIERGDRLSFKQIKEVQLYLEEKNTKSTPGTP